MAKPVDSTPRNVEFLKDLAEEDNQDILKLARKNGLKDDKLVDLMLTQLAGIAGAAYQKDPNTWLTEVAKFYNAGLPETGDLLNEDDVRGLKWIMDRYAKRLMSEAPQQSYSTMSDNNPSAGTPPPFGQATAPIQGGIVLPQPDPRSNAEAELLRSFLTSNYNPRPHLITNFINDQFKPYYEYFTQNPGALLQVLTHNFASAGKMAYDMWIANKHRVSMDPYANAYGQQYAQPNPYAQTSIPGMTAAKTPDELAEEKRWEKMDRMLDRKMRMDYMNFMANMGGNNQQQAAPPGTAYQIEDVVDIHGRPTGAKRQIPVPINQIGMHQGMDDSTKAFMTALQQQNNILLQSMHQPNTFLEKIATTALSTHQNSVDPFTAFGKILEYVNAVNQNKAQPETKSLDVISKEIDAKLALTQLNMQEKKEEREYNREIESERTANDSMKTYVDSIKDVVTRMLGPVVQNAMQGYLQQPGQVQQQQPQPVQAQQTQQMQQNDDAYMAAQQAEQLRQREYQAAQIRQQQQKMAEMQRQQEQQQYQQKSTDEKIAERTDGQLEQDFAEIDNQRREMEIIFQKVAAERAKRRMVRSGGIGTRMTQQQVYAPPPNSEPDIVHQQSFEERIEAGEKAAQEEMGESIAAGNENVEGSPATAGAVQTQLTSDDLQAMQASKDGIQAQPMEFGIGGVPKKEEVEGSTELGEEEEYEDEESDETEES